MTAQAASTQTQATVISSDGLNLRGAPVASGPVLQIIPFASVVSVTGSPTSDGWYPISYGALSGWASGDYLASGRLDPSAVRTATSLTTSNAGHTVTTAAMVPPLFPAGQTAGSSGGTPAAAQPAGSASLLGAPYQASASYYGVDDSATSGRMMACGAPFDPYNAHAAATNDWPCGTKLHIASADGRAVDVVVSDHGQYPQHWIDLTYAAFGAIADHKAGVIQVTVQAAP